MLDVTIKLLIGEINTLLAKDVTDSHLGTHTNAINTLTMSLENVIRIKDMMQHL